MKPTSYNPHPDLRRDRFGLFRFRSPLLTEYLLVFFPPGTEMFYFPGYAPCTIRCRVSCKHEGFPHSEISGSKVARHLPEAYRRHATSFIAISSLGIHHTLLNFLLGNSKTIPILSRAKAKQWDSYPDIVPRSQFHPAA